MLISSLAGGMGLNLTGASHLIVTDPFWNPGNQEQAYGRVHRLGQQHTVHVWSLVTKDSAVDKLVGDSLTRNEVLAQRSVNVFHRIDTVERLTSANLVPALYQTLDNETVLRLCQFAVKDIFNSKQLFVYSVCVYQLAY